MRPDAASSPCCGGCGRTGSTFARLQRARRSACRVTPPTTSKWRSSTCSLSPVGGPCVRGVCAGPSVSSPAAGSPSAYERQRRSADVLHLEEVETAWLSEDIGVPSLLRLQYFVRWDRDVGPPWTRRFRHAIEFELAERAAIRRHDTFIPASPRVADEIRRRRPDATVRLVPLCLDPDDYPPAPLDGPPRAGIIGTAGWPITAAAMRQLVDDLWPRVLRLAPDASLVVAGRGTRELGLQGRNVEVLGEVPSAVAFLRGLSVLLYPIMRGSGVKVKTLESVACGLPVVDDAAGCRGRRRRRRDRGRDRGVRAGRRGSGDAQRRPGASRAGRGRQGCVPAAVCAAAGDGAARRALPDAG